MSLAYYKVLLSVFDCSVQSLESVSNDYITEETVEGLEEEFLTEDAKDTSKNEDPLLKLSQ